MMETAADESASRPIALAIGYVSMVPASAKRAMVILMNGLSSTYPISHIVPIPINTRQAMSPLLNVSVYIGCRKSICIYFIRSSVDESRGFSW